MEIDSRYYVSIRDAMLEKILAMLSDNQVLSNEDFAGKAEKERLAELLWQVDGRSRADNKPLLEMRLDQWYERHGYHSNWGAGCLYSQMRELCMAAGAFLRISDEDEGYPVEC